MRQGQPKSPLKKALLLSSAVFIVAYVIFLYAWISVKDGYARGVVAAASVLTETIFDVTAERTEEGKDTYVVYFRPERHNAPGTIIAKVRTSTYTFNAPLTLAIMAAFFYFLKKERSVLQVARIYAEVLAMLFFVHLLYVFSLEGLKVNKGMMRFGYLEITTGKQFFWQYLWGFVDNMVIRFEPFLIGAFLYFRKGL